MANITLTLEEYQDILERIEVLEDKILDEQEEEHDNNVEIIEPDKEIGNLI